jgi:hypothetical protein
VHGLELGTFVNLVKSVVCVKWGALYGPEHVNRLYAMVARHTTPPFRLVCLTDDRSGIRPDVQCFDLPDLCCAVGTMGTWRKQILWGREVPGLNGVALFIDLDSVIVGSLDGCFSFGKPDDVILARNRALPFRKRGQTSVFRYPIRVNPRILYDFRADPQGIADQRQFEQPDVTNAVKGGVKFWPEAWTRQFRLHCMPPTRLPARASSPSLTSSRFEWPTTRMPPPV